MAVERQRKTKRPGRFLVYNCSPKLGTKRNFEYGSSSVSELASAVYTNADSDGVNENDLK